MSHRLRTAAWLAIPAALLAALAIDLSSSSLAVADDAPPMPMPRPSAPPMPQPPTAPNGNAPWRPEVRPEATTDGVPAPAAEPVRFTMEELKKLVGPVALYPDAVLASLLPASAFPLEVVQAARFVRDSGGKVESVPEDRGWDGSVVSLLQFPELVVWVDENLEWFERLGMAVALQQADVLEAIQQFRRDAKAAGNLKSNDKQVIVEQAPPADAGIVAVEDVICIEPAQPDVIYIPVYDPILVCRPPVVFYEPVITFGFGYWCGSYGPWAWYDIGWGWGWSPYRRHYAWGGGIFFHDHVRYWGHHHHSSHHHAVAGGFHHGRAWSAPYRIHRTSGVYATVAARTAAPRTTFGRSRSGAPAAVVSRVSARPPTVTRRPDRALAGSPRLDVRRPAPSVVAADGSSRIRRGGSDAASRLGRPDAAPAAPAPRLGDDAARRTRGGDDAATRLRDARTRDRAGDLGSPRLGGDDSADRQRRGRGAGDGVPAPTPVRPAPRLVAPDSPAPVIDAGPAARVRSRDDGNRLRLGNDRNRSGGDVAPAPSVQPQPRIRLRPEPRADLPQPDVRSQPRVDRRRADDSPSLPGFSAPVERHRPEPRVEHRPEPRVERRADPRPEPRHEPRVERSRPEPRIERSGGGRDRDDDDSSHRSSGNGRRR